MDRVATIILVTVGFILVVAGGYQMQGFAYDHYPAPWGRIQLASMVLISLIFSARDRLPQIVMAVAIALIAAGGILYPLFRFGF